MIKVLIAIFSQHRWDEGSERFPEFDFNVEFSLHFLIARIAEDASSAKGARSELHTALYPSDNISFGELLCHVLAKRLRRIELRAHRVVLLHDPFDVAIAEVGSEVGTFHRVGILGGQTFFFIIYMVGGL